MPARPWQEYVANQLVPFAQAAESTHVPTIDALSRPVTWLIVLAVVIALYQTRKIWWHWIF